MILALIGSFSIIQLIVAVVIFSLICWLVQTYIFPHLTAMAQTIITVVFVLLLCVWLWQTFIGPVS